MDLATRKLLNILIQLAEADKHFARAEREMIFRIAKEKNFDEQEVTELIRNPEPIEPIHELTPDQKFEYLFSSIELIFADHNVFESEVIFSKNIAVKLGFKKAIIDHFVQHYGSRSREEFKQIAFEDFN